MSTETATVLPEQGAGASTTELAPAVVSAPAPTDAVVDAWFLETFHNLPGLSVEFFNRFTTARDVLKARLRAKE